MTTTQDIKTAVIASAIRDAAHSIQQVMRMNDIQAEWANGKISVPAEDAEKAQAVYEYWHWRYYNCASPKKFRFTK